MTSESYPPSSTILYTVHAIEMYGYFVHDVINFVKGLGTAERECQLKELHRGDEVGRERRHEE